MPEHPLESVISNVSSGGVIWGTDQSFFLSDWKSDKWRSAECGAGSGAGAMLAFLCLGEH